MESRRVLRQELLNAMKSPGPDLVRAVRHAESELKLRAESACDLASLMVAATDVSADPLERAERFAELKAKLKTCGDSLRREERRRFEQFELVRAFSETGVPVSLKGSDAVVYQDAKHRMLDVRGKLRETHPVLVERLEGDRVHLSNGLSFFNPIVDDSEFANFYARLSAPVFGEQSVGTQVRFPDAGTVRTPQHRDYEVAWSAGTPEAFPADGTVSSTTPAEVTVRVGERELAFTNPATCSPESNATGFHQILGQASGLYYVVYSLLTLLHEAKPARPPRRMLKASYYGEGRAASATRACTSEGTRQVAAALCVGIVTAAASVLTSRHLTADGAFLAHFSVTSACVYVVHAVVSNPHVPELPYAWRRKLANRLLNPLTLLRSALYHFFACAMVYMVGKAVRRGALWPYLALQLLVHLTVGRAVLSAWVFRRSASVPLNLFMVSVVVGTSVWVWANLDAWMSASTRAFKYPGERLRIVEDGMVVRANSEYAFRVKWERPATTKRPTVVRVDGRLVRLSDGGAFLNFEEHRETSADLYNGLFAAMSLAATLAATRVLRQR